MEAILQTKVLGEVTFSEDEWQLLLTSFKSHYDFTIKAAAEVGGWLYGMNNARLFTIGEIPSCDLTTTQINYMLKSLEMVTTEEESKLYASLLSLFKEIERKYTELNNSLKEIHFVY